MLNPPLSPWGSREQPGDGPFLQRCPRQLGDLLQWKSKRASSREEQDIRSDGLAHGSPSQGQAQGICKLAEPGN